MYNDMSKPAIPLESEIDPNEYLLGPGDQLHIVVTSLENKMLPGQEFDLFIAETIEYYEFVGPVGELTLPSIGQFSTVGKTYQQIKDEIISAASKKSYKKIHTTVRLASIRTFKIQVLGAVEKPGYVVMSPVSRVIDAIIKTKGVQKYGSNEIVYLNRNEKKQKLSLKDFLLNGDLSQNPTLLEGDKIIVPFVESMKAEESNLTEYKTTQIIVHGFVRGPRSFSYKPGYRASDYIAMVGGVLNIGSENNTIIYRANGSELQSAYDEYVEPGDVIVVPESFRSRFFGNISILQTATAIATLILTYQAATKG
jgi:protein involved in polysaccharide export with SLBB domain